MIEIFGCFTFAFNSPPGRRGFDPISIRMGWDESARASRGRTHAKKRYTFSMCFYSLFDKLLRYVRVLWCIMCVFSYLEGHALQAEARVDTREHALRQVHGVGDAHHHELAVGARGPIEKVVSPSGLWPIYGP